MIRDKAELARELTENQYFYAEWRKRSQHERHQRHQEMLARGRPPEDLNRANWHGIATTRGGRRFQIGLKVLNECEYSGCFNCFLYHEAACTAVTPENILAQFDNALAANRLDVVVGKQGPRWGDPGNADVDQIDFNGSGSFLNHNETPREAQLMIFRRLAAMPFRNILIESRIEYAEIDQVRRLRGILRPDQTLTVAIGLESADDVIRELAIHKGYDLKDFEVCVEALAGVGADVLVYALVRPAFITEAEAFEDSLNTGRYLARLAERVRAATGNRDFDLTMKLEPAFIQEGGFLHFLLQLSEIAAVEGEEPLYETPWSFTVAGIVETLIAEGVADLINLQIGRSTDFPPPIAVTRNRDHEEDLRANGGRGSSERLDEALQDYNVDHDAGRLAAAVRDVIRAYPRTHAAWLAKVGRSCATVAA